MKKINLADIDFDLEEDKTISFRDRASVSILFGAGFSAPKGYPVGNKVNEKLLDFHTYPINFSPTGEIETTTTGEKPYFEYKSNYEKQYDFCLALIKYYNNKNHGLIMKPFTVLSKVKKRLRKNMNN